MLALGVSIDEVLGAAEGFNSNAGGGVVYDYGNEYIVKADINTSDPAELAAAVVRSDSRGIVTPRRCGKGRDGRPPAAHRRSVGRNEAGRNRHRQQAARRRHASSSPKKSTRPLRRWPKRCLPTCTWQPTSSAERVYRQFDKQPPAVAARRRVLRNHRTLLLPDELPHHDNLGGGVAAVDYRFGAHPQRHGLRHQHHEPRRHSHCDRLSGRRRDSRR